MQLSNGSPGARRDLSRCSLCSDCRGRALRDAVPLAGSFQRIRRRLGAIKITPVHKCCARCRRNENRNKQEQSEPFHALDANRSLTRCQCAGGCTDNAHGPDLGCVFELRILSGARKFLLRQGLWIEDLQIPPGQECSNGSMILLAVVLWRASFLVSGVTPPAPIQ